MVYEKFVNQLRGAGINVIEDGPQMHIMAMTDRDIDQLAGNREIKSGDTVVFEKGLEPIKGGLFDPKLTGSHSGTRWSYIRLSEPMPSPVMEEPIRRLLGLTQKDLEGVIAGTKQLGEFGTGPKALQVALSRINLPKAIENARVQIASGRKTKRDEAVRRLGYLKAAEKLGIHPSEWVLSKAPVLPPKFRPVTIMSDKKLPLVADANFLYRELIEANDNLAAMKELVGEDVGDERLAAYNAFKAVTGLGNPVHPKLREKNVRGLLKEIFGAGGPKTGALQKRLLSSHVDIVGRSVIIPDPSLDMDSIGIPEDKAWEVYRPFVARRLRRRGMPLTRALRQIEERTSLARQELGKEMDARPVIVNRAPVLHRFGMMAFNPRLVKGDAIRTSPLIVHGFGADYDGDTMSFQVPVQEDAVREARELMLPSRNLFAVSDFKTPMHQPTQDYTGGLYAATRGPNDKPTRTFRSVKDMIAAYRRGLIEIDDPVEVLNP
jgi:DNA-directed RNA polymerase subunit beta'